VDYKKELERVKLNNCLDSMPAKPWELTVDLGVNGDLVISKFMEVLELLVSHSGDDWLSDDEWREVMPSWLKESIPELTKEQTDKLLAETPQAQWDSLPWEFLSWLDAIRDRGWLWWGYKVQGSEAVIVVHIGMLPERIDAFKELLRSSGMKIKSENYSELS